MEDPNLRSRIRERQFSRQFLKLGSVSYIVMIGEPLIVPVAPEEGKKIIQMGHYLELESLNHVASVSL